MARTEFEIEITGLKIKYKGERQELPRFMDNFRSSVGGLLTPPEELNGSTNGHEITTVESTPEPKRKAGKQRSKSPVTGDSQTAALDWAHDPEKWGNPKQEWAAIQKIIWLLFVARNESSQQELTAGRISGTFNKKFKEAGKLISNNMSRDLTRAKTQVPPPVQNNTAVNPVTWYLTEAGIKQAEALVKQARGLS
jgi:hypothetical protein